MSAARTMELCLASTPYIPYHVNIAENIYRRAEILHIQAY